MDVKTYLNAPIPRWLALTAAVSVGVAVGGSSYFYFQKRFETELQIAVEEEVAATKKFYSVINKPSLEDTAEAFLPATFKTNEEILIEESYTSEEAVQELTEVVHNVFTDAEESTWDADAEEAKRDPSKPYILEHDEFYESENNSVTLTYFEGDNVLSDEKDEHIPDVDSLVGEENLLRFGHGSRDPNILYVRNENMDLDMEIVRNEGKYTEQVLGFMHSDQGGGRKRVLRMRAYDD